MTDSKESTILILIKGSNWRLSVLQSRKSGVCDVVSTMSDHPYRNEMVRLLLHILYAIRSLFCYGDEENARIYAVHLTTANQSEIRRAHLVSAN